MKLLKSLEELLYELVSWLVFYPITMWRAVVRPLQMMRYADLELTDRPEDQYDDTLSPPLFLLITLLIAQGVSSVIPSIEDPAEIPKQLSSGSNLLIARGVVFGVFPLVMAVTLLRWKAIKITRNSLRPPFFSQCYVAAPFVFVIGLALDFMLMPGEQGVGIGIATLILAILWYAQAEIRWFRQDLQIGTARAALIFTGAFLLAMLAALCVALVVSTELKNWSP